MRNIVDKVPSHAHDEVLAAVQEIYGAKSCNQALGLKSSFVARYAKLYPKAIESLEEAADLLFSYFAFPRRHWKSIQSTNVIESLFSAVKLRTDAARRIPKRTSALYLVFKLLTTQEQRLNRIKGYRLVPDVIDQLLNTQRTKLRKAA